MRRVNSLEYKRNSARRDLSKHKNHDSDIRLNYTEEITESKTELEDSWEKFLSFCFPNALSCSPCMVARHTLIITLTGIAPLPCSPNYRLLLQIGFLFFNVPFNAVSPNPVHR